MRRLAVISLALLSSAAVGQRIDTPTVEWDAKPVPLEVFGQFPQIDQPRISPDGKWIVAKFRSDGQQVLAILPIGGQGKPEFVSRDGEADAAKLGERRVVAWRWLGSDHLLVTLVYRDNFEGQWFDNVRYVAYDRVKKVGRPLGWNGSFAGTRLLWASRDGRPRVRIQRVNPANGTELAGSPEVIEVDVATGATSVVQGPNPIVSGWTADETGAVRFGSSYDRDSGRMRILYRPGAEGNFRTILNARSERYDEPKVPSIILAGTGKAYGYSRQDGHRALYEFDLDKMALGKKVYGVAGYDIDEALLNPAGDALEAVRVTEQRTRAVFFDPRLKEVQSALESSFGKHDVSIVSADRNREKIVFSVAATGQAPGYFLFDTQTGGIGLIAWHNGALKNARLNPVSTVRYAAGDGQQIEAVVTMPRHRKDAKNLPLVVLPHGGPWARDDADWDSYQWAQALAELGYVVLQPNFRGSTGYGMTWEKAAEGNWGYRMQDDLNDGVAFLAAKGAIDPKRVCIMGWSYGGYAAARAAQRDAATYRCAIAGAAPVNMRAMVEYDKDYLGRYGAKAALGSASTNLDDISPALHADQIKIPILIVQGAKDQRVPVAQARGFVARLKRAGKVEGKDFEYLEQPLNTHNLLREADRVQLLKATKAFLDKHNPA